MNCVVPYEISYQPIRYPIPKNHIVYQEKNTTITCISSIYLNWIFPVFSFLPNIFYRFSFSISFFLLKESINIKSGAIYMTHSPKRVYSNNNAFGLAL